MKNQVWTRREVLKTTTATAVGLVGLGSSRLFAEDENKEFLPTRVITRGPRHHWFGYYDKLQFDPTSRFVLGMGVDFEHRSPSAKDVIKIGMVDLEDNDRWIALGESSAWCWQQGCMLQWLPGSKSKVLWNDRAKDRFICRILDVETHEQYEIPHPIYSISPDGKSAVTPDFRRIQSVRPGYGYPGFPDPNADDLAPKESGILHVDLATGESKLIVSLAKIAQLGLIPEPQLGIKHYFNHLLYSPDGSRFIALHRWRYPDGSRLTRMITARPDGSEIRVVVPNGYTSHFIWRDSNHILAQSRHFEGNEKWANFLFEDTDDGGDVKEIGHGVLDPAGHLSYLSGNKWILNDSYPQGKERLQTPHIYHVESGRRIDLGKFASPKIYTGEWRVDTHPRYSPDGRYVCIDSPHKNQGRQLHLINISNVLS